MCGIAGANISPNEQVNLKKVAKAMLLAIEHRGYDATGFAFREKSGKIQVHKSDIPATIFVKRNLCLPKQARTFIAHTRFATQGAPEWNDNNHPIPVGTVVGVHNGCISNDDQLFRKLDAALVPDIKDATVRIAQVDSEAIFAMLNYGVVDRTTTLETVRGSAAIAWMDANDAPNTLHMARISSSPLYCAETDGGSVLFASTPEAVAAGIKAGGMTMRELLRIPEGCYMKVVDGCYEVVEDFEPAPYRYANAYTGTYTPARAYTPSDACNVTHIRGPQHGITDRMGGAVKDRDGFGNGLSLSDQARMHLADAGEFVIDSGEILDEADAEDRRTVEEYQKWWELNCQALDNAIDEDTSDDDDHRAFASFMTAPLLNSYYLADPGFSIQRPTEEEYLTEPRNMRREVTVEKWVNSLSCSGNTLQEACIKLHADIRPGDVVVTDIEGVEVYGHLYCAPETFPHGNYVIRAYMARPSRPGGFEAVFINRRMDEFKVVITDDGSF